MAATARWYSALLATCAPCALVLVSIIVMFWQSRVPMPGVYIKNQPGHPPTTSKFLLGFHCHMSTYSKTCYKPFLPIFLRLISKSPKSKFFNTREDRPWMQSYLFISTLLPASIRHCDWERKATKSGYQGITNIFTKTPIQFHVFVPVT